MAFKYNAKYKVTRSYLFSILTMKEYKKLEI